MDIQKIMSRWRRIADHNFALRKERQRQYDRARRKRPDIQARTRLQKARWQQENKESIAKRKHQWLLDHRAEHNARKRAYRARQKLLAKKLSV